MSSKRAQSEDTGRSLEYQSSLSSLSASSKRKGPGDRPNARWPLQEALPNGKRRGDSRAQCFISVSMRKLICIAMSAVWVYSSG